MNHGRMKGEAMKTIEELRAMNLPRCTAKDIGIVPKEGMELDQKAIDFIADLDAYLHKFAAPSKRNWNSTTVVWDCLNCGQMLTGLVGSFQWGIANGIGECGNCHWPCQALHRPVDRDGKEMFTDVVKWVLQAHPDEVQTRRELEAEQSSEPMLVSA